MAFHIEDDELAGLTAMPEVLEAAKVGGELIALWPLTTAQELGNDAKYAEDLQVRVTQSAAQLLTGQDVTLPDAEFVYEGAIDIPGRPQEIVDALLNVNDAYERLHPYSHSGDTSLVMNAVDDLQVDWSEATASAVAAALDDIEAAAKSGASNLGNGEGSANSSDAQSVARRLAVVIAAVDGLFGIIAGDGSADVDQRAAASRVTPVMLYLNELCERMSIPRMFFDREQFESLLGTYADAAKSGSSSAESLARAIAPLAQQEWRKHHDDVVFDPVAAKKAAKDADEKQNRAKLAEKFKDIPEDPNKPHIDL
ncbi:hypothetical protein [Bifidobacterium sp. ESL0790]|uniref:hypothetical protein n=1 Tax=Bifidobacterium sp. ESL0790 TaxID=2983233 RepID=UPI0023F826B3|nr:hypothetical protein [Bifidobacterium sp. ESL0790]WEV72603.1 hypothetical protein OZY47_01035 [Bifidobacterium sp. ESL0790]